MDGVDDATDWQRCGLQRSCFDFESIPWPLHRRLLVAFKAVGADQDEFGRLPVTSCYTGCQVWVIIIISFR